MDVFFFFFKQKTAYEIRTGDWSSDVCSSDLPVRHFTSGFEQVIAAQLGTPLHLSTATASHPTSPISEIRRDEKRFSTISADELPHQADTLSELSVDQRSPHERFSIEAFPVQAENTLVNVYQATTPTRKTRVKKPSFKVHTASKKPVASSSTSYPGKSLPIQPFRPTPRRRKSTPVNYHPPSGSLSKKRPLSDHQNHSVRLYAFVIYR